MFHNYDDFSPGVAFLQIPECLTDFAQRVRSVDYRCDLAGLNELLQNDKVLVFRDRNIRVPLLAQEKRRNESLYDVTKSAMAAVRYVHPLRGEHASAV